MRPVRRGAKALLFVIALLASLAVSSGAASATSAYDNVMFGKEQIEIPNWVNNQYEYLNVSTGWYNRIQAGAAKDSLNDARNNGGHWMLVNGGDYLYVIWSEAPSVTTSFFMVSGQPSWGIASGNEWNIIRLTAQNGVVTQDSFLSQTSQNVIYLGNKPSPLPRTGLVFSNYDNTYPSGYEGELIPTEPPSAKYVAMGDSFSSGEGVSPFETGTDTGSNSCHRSSLAYPRLLQGDLDLGLTAFVACSGTTTDNVLNGGSAEGAWNELPQIDALSEGTDVVTITIGGNDVGFKSFATACTIGSCDFATTAYSDIHGKIVNDLPGALEDVYEAIDGATSSTADIYVVGYPHIAPAEMPTGPNSACYPLNGGTDNPDPELNDGATVYAGVSELNSVIEDAVTYMNSTKFHFVDPNLSGSPFIGHDWCQQDRYFVQIGMPIPPSNTEYSFHPNVDGQEAYKTVVEGEID